ncbi:MAG TPA: TonB-dependent receptor [Steroidobacteraceae bacterium]|jgi:vitamin B12 transporter|nr:TonB-dependent receptor [Steroidobacteraceae bacterium]
MGTGLRGGLGFVFTAACLCGAAGASAQTTSGSPPGSGDDKLENVTVTAKKLEEELPDILQAQGVHVDTISSQQIVNGGYVDVSSALQYLAPGLFISPKNGPFDYVHVSLQGSRTEDVLWLVDGIRMNNRLYGGTTPLDTMPAAMVDSIQILQGGEALYYGTQAVAGAVNIVTKPFSDTPDGQVSVGGDTNDSGHFDGYYRNSLGHNHFVFFVDFDISSGFQPFPSDEIQPSDTDRDRAYHLFTVGAKYAYDFSDDLRFSTMLEHTSARLNDSQPELVAQAFNDRDENILTAKLDFTPGDAVQLFGKAYYHWWQSHYTEYDNVLGSPGTLSDVEDHGFWGYNDRGLNLMGKFQLNGNFSAVVGYDLQNYSGHDAVLVIEQQTETDNAVFAQLVTTPNLIDHTVLALGARYNVPNVGESAAVWSFSGKHDFSDAFFIRGEVGTAFRLPTAEELFANDPDDERGDPNLKPEKSTNANLSIGGNLGLAHFKWELIAFGRDVTNLIDYATFDADTDQAVFGNVPGTVRVRGGELQLGLEYPDVSVAFDYTYSHSVDDNNQQIDAIPVQQAKASFDYHPEQQPFGFTLSAIYVGAEYATGLGADGGRAQFGEYPLVDLSGRYFIDSAHHHIISLRLQNIFDRNYATGLGTAESDVDGSTYTFEDLGVPRTLEARYTYKF